MNLTLKKKNIYLDNKTKKIDYETKKLDNETNEIDNETNEFDNKNIKNLFIKQIDFFNIEDKYQINLNKYKLLPYIKFSDLNTKINYKAYIDFFIEKIKNLNIFDRKLQKLLINILYIFDKQFISIFLKSLCINNLQDKNIFDFFTNIILIGYEIKKELKTFLNLPSNKNKIIINDDLKLCILGSTQIYLIYIYYLKKKKITKYTNSFIFKIKNNRYKILSVSPFVLYSINNDNLYLVFKGTTNIYDLIIDLNTNSLQLNKIIKILDLSNKIKKLLLKLFSNILKLKFHSQICIESIYIIIELFKRKIILNNKININKIILTGHSLGGSLSTTCSILLSELSINDTKSVEIISNNFGTLPSMIKDSNFNLWYQKLLDNNLPNKLIINHYLDIFDPIPKLSIKNLIIYFILSVKYTQNNYLNGNRLFQVEEYNDLFNKMKFIKDKNNCQIIGNVNLNYNIDNYNLIPFNPILIFHHIKFILNNFIKITPF